MARAQPRILGALLSILAGVLDVWPTVDRDRYPRMAEFARVLVCVDRILGTDGLARYEERVQRGVADVTGNDPVSRALQAKIRGPWTGSAATLLSAIEFGKPDGYEARFWPTSPQALTGQLRRIAPALRAAGWQVTDAYDRHKKRVEWTLVPPQGQQGEDADDQW